jgi:hypothetical protein
VRWGWRWNFRTFDVNCNIFVISVLTDLSFKLSIKIKSRVSIFPLFVTIQNNFVFCKFQQLYLGNHSQLDTCSNELLFSQWPIISPLKIITFPPELHCTLIK